MVVFVPASPEDVPGKQNMPDKLIGFTQSSYPACRVAVPSDEDYKTLLS